MSIRKKTIVPSIILGLAVLAGAAAYTSSALADSNQKANTVSELSAKLGVDQTKVEAAMSEIRQEHQAERQKQAAASLDKAVSDGVINVEQKQKILDKQAEHRAQMEKQRTEMVQWFKDNGIDETKLRGYGVGMMGGGRGHGGGPRHWDK